MNDTLALVNALADKLQVPVAHIWQALLAQAPISAAAGAVQIVLFLVGLCVWTKFVRIKTTKKERDGYHPQAEWEDLGAACGWGSVLVGWVFLIAAVALDGPVILAGFVNPDYWALNSLLSLK